MYTEKRSKEKMCRIVTAEEKLLAEQRRRQNEKMNGRGGEGGGRSPVGGAGRGVMDHFHEEVQETETPVSR